MANKRDAGNGQEKDRTMSEKLPDRKELLLLVEDLSARLKRVEAQNKELSIVRAELEKILSEKKNEMRMCAAQVDKVEGDHTPLCRPDSTDVLHFF